MTPVDASVRTFPDAPDVFACAELGCAALDTDTVEGCNRQACPFTHQRRREEDQVEKERKDAKATVEG